MKNKLFLIIFCFFITGCIEVEIQPNENAKTETPAPQSDMDMLPNPASVFCEQQGYKLEIRTVDDGSQSGVCIFTNGSECDEWAYYRGECAPTSGSSNLPNPASSYCEQQGFTLEIITAPDGSQTGFCKFPDGSECDEWAYFRGECQPNSTGSTNEVPEGWKVYTNEILGYHFYLPASAQITTNDEPLNSLFINGSGMGAETWSIAHPKDRPEFQLPAGVDLEQWLSDHNLLGENRQPDEQIAGTTAIHFRHEASPQSNAFDQYFFANARQLYLITIGHSSNVEDWDLNTSFLQSFHFSTSQAEIPLSSASSTVLPDEIDSYLNWAIYTNSEYGFSIRFPDGWKVEEVDKSDPLLGGHALNLHNILDDPAGNIRITFRQIGDETLLWPTGVGDGEFISSGTLDIADQPAIRIFLVCPTGEITQIWYHQSEIQSNIARGNLEFGIIFSTGGYCESGDRLQGEIQHTGEMIIASLHVP
jgi:putative hemolysin